MENAHDKILRWCRSRAPGFGNPCMRVRDNGIHLVIDVNTSMRANILACGHNWEEVSRDLKNLGIQLDGKG